MKPCPRCGEIIEDTKQACNECWAALPLAYKKRAYLDRGYNRWLARHK